MTVVTTGCVWDDMLIRKDEGLGLGVVVGVREMWNWQQPEVIIWQY